jgi:hypothetical protein
MAMAGFGTMSLAACGGGDRPLPSFSRPLAAPPHPSRSASRRSNKLDNIHRARWLPAGHLRHGRLNRPVPDYLNNGTQGQSSRRSGDHHDGMHFFSARRWCAFDSSNDRALLVSEPREHL